MKPAYNLFAVVLAVLVVAATPVTKPAENPVLKQATTKYEQSLSSALAELEKKTLMLRQEYENKVAISRKTYIATLKMTQAEEARKGNAALAQVLKESIASLEAESSPIWPTQITPDGVTTIAKAAPGQGINYTWTFNDEATVRKFWVLPPDKNWQIKGDGFYIKTTDTPLSTNFGLKGDFDIMLDCQNLEWLEVCGERVEWKGRGKEIMLIHVVRKDNVVKTNVDGKPIEIKIKLSEVNTARPIRLKGYFLHIRGLKLTGKTADLTASE